MYTLISVLIIIACVLLVLVVLMQESKGGGLSSAFGSSGGNQIMGAKKTGDFLERATWTLAIALLFLSLVSNFWIPRKSTEQQQESEIQEQVETAPQQTQPQEIPPLPEPTETPQNGGD